MRSVELNELKEQVLLAGNEALAIRHHGKLLGYFYPVVQDQAEVDAAWNRLERAVEQVMAETGLDEEGLVQVLVPNQSEL